MAIVKCVNSHFYDNEKFSECPHCAEHCKSKNTDLDSVTVAMVSQERQVENYAAQYLKQSAPSAHVNLSVDRNEEKTVSIYEKKGISRYTAGWLVCVKGEELGKDFPLYAGFNRIGRAYGNDIVLKDSQVSREEHCSIIYEEKKNVFYISPKGGNLVYLGDEVLVGAQQIKSGQVITVGETKLEFVAFCIGEKRWTKKE